MMEVQQHDPVLRCDKNMAGMQVTMQHLVAVQTTQQAQQFTIQAAVVRASPVPLLSLRITAPSSTRLNTAVALHAGSCKPCMQVLGDSVTRQWPFRGSQAACIPRTANSPV